jgi:autoinducer 2 (AI-2) kinase
VSPRWLLGLDLGGGGIRALAVDPGGGRTATAFRSVAPVPRPELPMGVDLDAPRLWQLLGEAVGEALARAGGDASDVVGIAASAMRHGNVVLDGEGRVILATPNRDARGLACFLELAASQGPALHRRTGHWPNPVQPLARLLWLAREAPGDLERAALHLSLSDWLAWRLCGEAATEPSQAGESGVLEIEAPGWAWDVICGARESGSAPCSRSPPKRSDCRRASPSRWAEPIPSAGCSARASWHPAGSP